ncbi:extracellular solute-binding protein, partial [Candidatus Zixiibacteriota bacterium]
WTFRTGGDRMRWTKYLIFLFYCLLLTGCGGGSRPGEKTVEFWQFWTDPQAKAIIEQAVAEFEKENQGVKVNITDLTWNDGHQKIVSAFAAGRPPDLLELGSDWIAEFAAEGVLLDLTAELAKTQSQFVGWSPAIWEEKCYALPWYLGTRVIFINCEHASAVGLDCHRPPITWDNMIEWAEALHNLGSQVGGFGANAPEKHRLYKKFLPFLWSNGGRILSEDGNFSVIDSELAITALKYYVKLFEKSMVEKQAVLDELFVRGRLSMVISGDWLYKKLREADEAPDFALAMLPFPAPGQGGQISFAGGEYLTIPTKANNPIGALGLARTLTNERNSINLCIATGGSTPANVTAMDNPYFTDNAERKVFIRQLQSSRATPPHPQWVYIEQIIEEAVEKAMYKRLTPEEALNEAARKITKLLRED